MRQQAAASWAGCPPVVHVADLLQPDPVVIVEPTRRLEEGLDEQLLVGGVVADEVAARVLGTSSLGACRVGRRRNTGRFTTSTAARGVKGAKVSARLSSCTLSRTDLCASSRWRNRSSRTCRPAGRLRDEVTPGWALSRRWLQCFQCCKVAKQPGRGRQREQGPTRDVVVRRQAQLGGWVGRRHGRRRSAAQGAEGHLAYVLVRGGAGDGVPAKGVQGGDVGVVGGAVDLGLQVL